MVSDFTVVRFNGTRSEQGRYIASVLLLDQINDPAFHPKAFEWTHEGRVYTRPVDGSATLTAQPLPDGQGIVVLQSADRFGSDNVVVLSPSGEIRARITNPYRDSNFFVPGDSCCFDSIGVGGGKIALGIQVRRHLQGKPRDALPLYEAHYDPATLKLTKLEWVPWT